MAKAKVIKEEPSRPVIKSDVVKKKVKLAKRLDVKKGIVKKKKHQWFNKPTKARGVVYLSHIPHGFYEDQIEKYFSQFGQVTAVSVPKSKTGKSRGYGFVEFKHPEVAEIAADTMNNYLMFNRLVKAKYIPPKEQRPRYFLAAKMAKATHTTTPEKAALLVKHNRSLKNRKLKNSLEVERVGKLLRRSRALQRKLQKLGADYEFQVEKANLESVSEKRKAFIELKRKGTQVPSTENKAKSLEDSAMTTFEDDTDQSSSEDKNLQSGNDNGNTSSEIIKKTNSKRSKKKMVEGSLLLKLQKSKLNRLNKSSEKLPDPIKSTKSKKTKGPLLVTPIQKKNQSQKGPSSSESSIKEKLNSKPKQTKKSPLPSKIEKQIKSIENIKATSSVKHSRHSIKPPVLLQTSSKKHIKSPKEVTLKLKSPKVQIPGKVKEVGSIVLTPKTKSKKQMTPKLTKSKPSTAKAQTTGNLIMEVDENDGEITFKTPPNVVKKSLNGKKSQTPKQVGNRSLKSSPSPGSSMKKPRHRS